MACRRCTVCDGMTHHWLEEVEEADEPTYTHVCQHCEAVGFACDWCDGSGLADEEDDGEERCDVCHGEGVTYVRDMPACVICDARVAQPLLVTVEDRVVCFCSEDCHYASGHI